MTQALIVIKYHPLTPLQPFLHQTHNFRFEKVNYFCRYVLNLHHAIQNLNGNNIASVGPRIDTLVIQMQY